VKAAATFDQQLAKVAGTIHRVNMSDHHERMQAGLLYYSNKANDLRKSAEILIFYGAPRDNSSMLAGMSLEVLLKGIARALDNPAENTHNLIQLVEHIGIPITPDDKIVLEVMTEHILWAGRYTAPRRATDWLKVWELQAQQRSVSGSISDMENAARTIALGTFRRLFKKFSVYFDRARQSRYESAEFN
jgi:hypothetical protein